MNGLVRTFWLISALLWMQMVWMPMASAEARLPALGEPADQVLSPRQEAQIGRELMAQARRHLDINRDPEVTGYVERLGGQLAMHTDSQPVDGYTFFVAHNPSINAFAAPGGYIGVNSGLILAADREAQVAGVLAHEIAHVAQRHIARSFARQKTSNLTTLAAVLAGLLVGAGSEAGQAAITGGIAAGQQQRLDYTRANEFEADRIGIALLARAGYSPDGMTAFFETLRRAAGPGGSSVPEFLRTHPLSQTRIAEAASRADALRSADQKKDSLEFQLMRQRLRALDSSQPDALYQRWLGQAPEEVTHDWAEAAREYGLAVLELRLEQPEKALERLEPLYAQDQDNLHYGLALARAYRANGDAESALEIWDKVYLHHPSSYAAVTTGSHLLLATGAAGRAVKLLTDFLRSDKDTPPQTWRHLAEAAEAAGQPLHSHEALGEYYVRVNRLSEALKQFDMAVEEAEEESSDAVRIETRIDQVKELQRKRVAQNPLQ